MRSATLATALLILVQGTAGADEFKAWVFSVEGDKVSFIKDDGTSKTKGVPKGQPITLRVADNVLVLQGGHDDATKKYEGAIVESGLKYDLFDDLKPVGKKQKGTRYHLTHLVTNDKNEITEIRLHDDVAAKIMKVEGNNLNIVQIWGAGFYGGPEEGVPRVYHASDKVTVVKGWLNPKTRKFEATEVEGGLKNDIFKSTVRARLTSRGEGVILIRVFDPAKVPSKE
jgi:hypothetical protein